MKVLGVFVGAVLIAVAIFALYGWLVMALWNYLVPAIVHGGTTITFWQGVALYFLTSILVGRLGVVK